MHLSSFDICVSLLTVIAGLPFRGTSSAYSCLLSWAPQMVFLEFYEALLGCAEVKSQMGVQPSAESLSEAMTSLAQAPQYTSPLVCSEVLCSESCDCC